MTNRKTFCKSGPRFPGTDVGRGQGGKCPVKVRDHERCFLNVRGTRSVAVQVQRILEPRRLRGGDKMSLRQTVCTRR